MCGIFGFQTKNNAVLSAEQRGVLLTMLSLGNEGRGDDSWGFYNHNELIKGLGGISKSLYKFVKSEGGFGHTRRATTGSISVPNAHPFDIGSVIGAHNGIVFNHDELNKKYRRNHEVDSMHIFSHLSDGKDLEEIRAYGSIQWVDKEDVSKIKLCRLSGGELGIAALENRKGGTIGVVWSSDEKHLAAALTCLGVKHSMFKVEMGMVYVVTNGKLHTTDRKLEFASRTYSETGVTWEGGYSGSRTYRSHGGHWSSGVDEDMSDQYKEWLKNRRGQSHVQSNLSNEQGKLWEDIRDVSKSEKGEVTGNDVSLNSALEEQLDRELERALEDDSELSFGPNPLADEEGLEDMEIEVELEEDFPLETSEKKAFVVVGDGMILIPDALAECDIEFESIVKGGCEFSHKLGGWVKFDQKKSHFFVASNANEATGNILL